MTRALCGGPTLVRDDGPAQSSFRRFQNKELEMFAIIVDRSTPFTIVILEHQGGLLSPLSVTSVLAMSNVWLSG